MTVPAASVYEDAHRFYAGWLWSDAAGAAQARRYLLERGTPERPGRAIAREVALLAGVGYVPVSATDNSANRLATALQSRGFSLDDLKQASVACRLDGGHPKGLDFPEGGGYLVFPIRAVDGTVQGFKFRAVPGLARADGMRYTGTSGSMAGAMFGWEQWRPTDRTVVAIEGEIDQLSIQTARLQYPEIPFPLAWYGKELTAERLEWLKGRVDCVLLALDADGGGWDGMLRSGRALGEAGIRHALLQLPKGMDPNEVLTRGSVGVLAHFLQSGPRRTLLEVHAEHLLDSGISAADPVYAARSLQATFSATRALLTADVVRAVARNVNLPLSVFGGARTPIARVRAESAAAAPADVALATATVGA